MGHGARGACAQQAEAQARGDASSIEGCHRLFPPRILGRERYLPSTVNASSRFIAVGVEL